MCAYNISFQGKKCFIYFTREKRALSDGTQATLQIDETVYLFVNQVICLPIFCSYMKVLSKKYLIDIKTISRVKIITKVHAKTYYSIPIQYRSSIYVTIQFTILF